MRRPIATILLFWLLVPAVSSCDKKKEAPTEPAAPSAGETAKNESDEDPEPANETSTARHADETASGPDTGEAEVEQPDADDTEEQHEEAKEAQAPAPKDAWKRATVAGVSLGMSESNVIDALGEPKERTKPRFQGATGTYVSTWKYEEMELYMEAREKEGDAKVDAIRVEEPSKARTNRDIGAGSSLADLKKAYPGVSEEENDTYLVGSRYGGISFWVSDGKVTGFFIGATSE